MGLFDRLFLWTQFDPRTYPRLPYVTRITTRRLHLFTLIQFICLAILYGLKAVKRTAMVFPFFIALLVFVRRGLAKYFTKMELEVLDAEEELTPDPEPEKKEIAKPCEETVEISVKDTEEAEQETAIPSEETEQEVAEKTEQETV